MAIFRILRRQHLIGSPDSRDSIESTDSIDKMGRFDGFDGQDQGGENLVPSDPGLHSLAVYISSPPAAPGETTEGSLGQGSLPRLEDPRRGRRIFRGIETA